jgi:hypothetical protein
MSVPLSSSPDQIRSANRLSCRTPCSLMCEEPIWVAQVGPVPDLPGVCVSVDVPALGYSLIACGEGAAGQIG